jgi:hypothetical protein
MSETEYVSTFERHNLMNGDPWCDKYASFSASALLGAYPKGHIVCLGAKVSAAFYTKGPLEWWSAVWMGGPTIYKVPHPSGMNRMWNDSRNVERLCIVVREAIAASAGVR